MGSVVKGSRVNLSVRANAAGRRDGERAAADAAKVPSQALRRRVVLKSGFGIGAGLPALLAAACQPGDSASGGSPLGAMTKDAVTLRFMQ